VPGTEPAPPAEAAAADLAARLRRIAHDALLDQVERGDPRHALQRLLKALQPLPGRRFGVQALDERGGVLWSEAVPADAVPAATIDVPHLGGIVGRLLVPAPAGAPAAGLRDELDPLMPALGALLRACAAPPDAGHMALVRAALAGADTFVWEWDLDSDRLGDIAEGLRQLGYAPGELGDTQDDWNALIHPEDRAANHEAYLRHASGEQEIYEHVYRARAADGSWRWLMERGRIVERHADGRPRRMVGTQTDVTERRAVARAASEATRRLERIAGQVSGMLYQFEMRPGRKGQLTYVSERGQYLFGLPLEAALEDIEQVWDLIEVEDRKLMAQALKVSAANLTEWRCEFRARRADGQMRWMLGNAMPEKLADGRLVWYGYLEDVTERRELEQARRDAAVAEAANRAKTDFLSRMSHELRTPLNAVLGFAQLMEIDRSEPPAEGQRRRLAMIRDAGEHLLHMIGDLLDLTRIESGGMTLQPEPVPLRALAAQALEMVRDSADKAQVTLALADGGDALVVLADRTRLRQVLLNLLSNAVKYSRPGGRVELRVAAGADGLPTLTVADTGVGIAEDELPLVFEPFQRGRQARGGIEGAGIGLSVTRALVQLMGGRIAAHSRLGEGSVFTVALPAAGAAAPSLPTS
jgi:PAS domain S-box-containing protein